MKTTQPRRRRHAIKLPLSALFAGAALLVAAAPALAAPIQELDIAFEGRTTGPSVANEAEIAAFDPATQRVFTTNASDNALDIYDFSDVGALGAPIESVDLAPFGGGPNSVAASNGLIAVAVEGATPQALGTVQFFDAQGDRLGSVQAGALPDMLTFTKDGSYLLVANEGEPSDDGLVDPEGSVTVVDMRAGLDDLVVRQVDFHGVPLRGPVRVFTPGNDASRDLEPEYVSTSGETAYVGIQEANAIGILDIPSGEFEVVRSLGFKDWGESPLDTSNGDDGGPLLRSWTNVFGMYQPDAIATYELPFTKRVRCTKGPDKGTKRCPRTERKTFVATANEGDVRDWSFFSEEAEVADLTLDSAAFAASATDADQLGELKVTSTLGDRDGDGDYDRLYAFGGRSLSVLDASGAVVDDTGGQLEQLSQSLDAGNFNKSNSAGSSVDNRSDDKGPEPEALDVGRVAGHQYAFVAAERSGGIYAYDLTATKGEARYADAYLNTRESDLGPEGALFLPAAESPTGGPLLLLTYEVTSTVAAYSVSVEP